MARQLVTVQTGRNARGEQTLVPAALAERARAFAADALAPRTRQAYAWGWERFVRWCTAHRLRPLPACPETVGAWLTAHASDYEGKPWSKSSLALVLAAVTHVHAARGAPLDRAHPTLKAIWKGAARHAALVRGERQAAPLMADELRKIVDGLGDRPRELRDRALLLLGWAAALRQDELIQLDWMSVGTGKGVVKVEGDRVEITLLRSKTGRDSRAHISLSSVQMPAVVEAVRAWAENANLTAGAPFLRAVDRHGRISARRLCGRSVSRIVQARMRAYRMGQGDSVNAACERAMRYSGHSLRSGLISSAAAQGIPGHLIAQHSRHRSQRALARYIREQDCAAVLGGVGF